MIMTREQFELFKSWLSVRESKLAKMSVSTQDATDTIEALEKVSRAVLTLDLMKAGLEGGSTQSIRKADMELGVAMVALPDWLTGANNQ